VGSVGSALLLRFGVVIFYMLILSFVLGGWRGGCIGAVCFGVFCVMRMFWWVVCCVWVVFCIMCVGALFDFQCVCRLWLGAGLMVFGCWICVVVCVLVVLLVVFSGVVLGWWVGGCCMVCTSSCLGVV